MEHVIIHGKKFVKYISAESIDDRVKQLAQEIKTTIDLNEYIMVVLLNGPPAADTLVFTLSVVEHLDVL